MAYTRGRFGVEYQPNGTSETHHLRWLVVAVALLVLVTFAGYKISHRKPSVNVRQQQPRQATVSQQAANGRAQPPPQAAVPKQTTTDNGRAQPSRQAAPVQKTVTGKQPPPTNNQQPVTKPKAPTTTIPPEARRVEKWLETAQARPDKERVLLERLAEAERQKNVPVAIDTIKKLYVRPTMADLQDTLVRRLGDLNLQHLLSATSTPWTAVVKARRGDSRDRIAREHRTTPTAISKLNPDLKWEKLQPGDSVRVLDFPNAVLVVYKQRGYADLSLKNGQFFRRYYVSVSTAAKSAVYPIAAESGATAHARLRELGVRADPGDRAEIEMFLAPGSRITVAE